MSTNPPKLEETLDRHRVRLEETLSKLRKALKHWQIYSAEYEALREELQTLPPEASREEMLAVGNDFGGTLVDGKEVRALVGDGVGVLRSVGQTVDAVGRRIEYVQDNIEKVEKQIEQNETKLSSLLVVSDPDLQTEDGLPVMDIHEELDEDGNVINATVNGNDPNSAVRPVNTDALKPLEGLMEEGTPGNENSTKEREVPVGTPPQVTVANPPETRLEGKPPAKAGSGKIEDKDPNKPEEGGGFVKVVDDPEVKEDDFVREVPGESEEDALLRRQMLNYNLQDLGAVVAELNLDEEGAFYGYEEEDTDEEYGKDNYEDDEDEDEGEEEEDEYGRTTKRVISTKYQREMEALAKKIKDRAEKARLEEAQEKELEKTKPPPKTKRKGVRFAEELDVSPAPLPPLAPPEEGNALPLLVQILERDMIARDRIAKAGADPTAPKTMVKPASKKASIFKNERVETKAGNVYDEAKRIAPLTAEAILSQDKVPKSAVNLDVVERSPGTSSVPVQPPSLQPRNPSRPTAAKTVSFSSEALPSSTANSPSSPSDEPQQTMKDFVVERPPGPSSSTTANPPDELDLAIHRNEVATEYHRLRTKMIQREGGFMETDEEKSIVPLEDENGETPKISRFKAARLKGLQSPK